MLVVIIYHQRLLLYVIRWYCYDYVDLLRYMYHLYMRFVTIRKDQNYLYDQLSNDLYPLYFFFIIYMIFKLKKKFKLLNMCTWGNYWVLELRSLYFWLLLSFFFIFCWDVGFIRLKFLKIYFTV